MTFDSSDEAGKIFVGGLSWQTTRENLESYFGRYGEIVDSVVMVHAETGKSRGFGFITFKDPASVPIALSSGPHLLDGKAIDPKACTKRNVHKERTNTDSLKVFLGGLPLDITEAEIAKAFEKFGGVSDINIMYDQEKQKPRGFGFLTFDTQDALQRACREHYVNINGKQIECKAAQPRNSRPRQPRQGGYQPGGRQDAGIPGQAPGGWPQMHGNAGPQQAPDYSGQGGYAAGYNAYQQQPQAAAAYQQPDYQANYNSGYGQGYGAQPAATGYAPTYSTPPAGQYAPQQQQQQQYGYNNSYAQSDSQYGPTKTRQSGGEEGGYGGASTYKTGEGYSATGGGQQAYHPYK